MRRPLIAAGLLAIPLFGVGYVVGQVKGPDASSAAPLTVNQPQVSQTQTTDPRGGGWGHMGPRADGTVTAISGNTITVKKDSDQGQTGEYGNVTTIVLSGSTTYEADHDSGTVGSKAAIKVGSYVIAEGTLSSDGTSLAASHVSLRPSGPDGGNGGSGAPATFVPPSNTTGSNA